jgi:hypothetical protein
VTDTPIDPEEVAEADRKQMVARWKNGVGRILDRDEVADWEKKNRVPTKRGFMGLRKVIRRLKP